MKSIEKHLAECKMQACREWPYASSAILSLGGHESSQVKDIAVDEYWRLYYNPVWMETAEPQLIQSKILSEVGHLLLRHSSRAKAILPAGDKKSLKKWAQAADMAVFGVLPVKVQGCVPEEHNPRKHGFKAGCVVEYYYRELLAQEGQQGEQQNPAPDDKSKRPGGPADADDPADAGDSGGDAESDPGSKEPTDSDVPGDGGQDLPEGGDGGQGLPEGGSAGDGVPRPWELGEPENGKEGGIQPHEAEQMLRDMANRARSAGTTPGNMKSYVKGILEPKLDPKKLLAGAIRAKTDSIISGDGDKYSYRRPARRQRTDGVLRPKPYQRVPSIAIVIDTSGSMNMKDLSMSLGMVSKVLSGLNLRSGVRVIAGDTEIHSDLTVSDVSKIDLSGGGGTDMGDLLVDIDQIKKNKPDLVLVCTDGYTDWPRRKTSFTVIACITQSDPSGVPDWIKVVPLNELCGN